MKILTEDWLCADHSMTLSDFTCVDSDNDNEAQLFLQEESLALMERNLVCTRIFLNEDKKLIGFYSLFNNIIKINKDKREQLAIYLPHAVKEIPAIRLHSIGIDNEFQGRGYGDVLMASILYNCALVSRISGCSLITVESTKNAKGFYKKYRFVHLRKEGHYDLMGINTKGIQHVIG